MEPKLKTQHYWVQGRTLTWRKEANIKLLAAWLVLTWNEPKGRYDRSVRTAEDEKAEDLAAIYHVRVEMGDLDIDRVNKRYILKVPNPSLRLDGTPRSSDAVHKAVERSDVAQCINSSYDSSVRNLTTPNCKRDWTPEWTSLGSYKRDAGIQSSGQYLAMGLKLNRAVKAYDELFYDYHWG
jgi:hypothetical protein